MKFILAIGLAFFWTDTSCVAQVSEEDVESTFLTDYDEAVTTCNETGKPLFVYVFDKF
ncbi:MAG: hypothetical protein ACR2NP_02995 [Pirellulaceae bacterium]